MFKILGKLILVFDFFLIFSPILFFVIGANGLFKNNLPSFILSIVALSLLIYYQRRRGYYQLHFISVAILLGLIFGSFLFLPSPWIYIIFGLLFSSIFIFGVIFQKQANSFLIKTFHLKKES